MRCSLSLSGLGLAFLACTQPTEEPPAAHPRVFASAGDRQAGLIGQPLPIPLEVTVLGPDGTPVPGAAVWPRR